MKLTVSGLQGCSLLLGALAFLVARACSGSILSRKKCLDVVTRQIEIIAWIDGRIGIHLNGWMVLCSTFVEFSLLAYKGFLSSCRLRIFRC